MKIGFSACIYLKIINVKHFLLWLSLATHVLISKSSELRNENTEDSTLYNSLKDRKGSKLRTVCIRNFGRHTPYGNHLIRDTGKLITSDGEFIQNKNSKCPITLHDDNNFDSDVLENVMDTSEMFEKEYYTNKQKSLVKNNVFVMREAAYLEYFLEEKNVHNHKNNDSCENSEELPSTSVYEFSEHQNLDSSKKYLIKKTEKKCDIEHVDEESDIDDTKIEIAVNVVKEEKHVEHARIMKSGDSIIIVGGCESASTYEVVPLTSNELNFLNQKLFTIYRAIRFEDLFFKIDIDDQIRNVLQIINNYERRTWFYYNRKTHEKMVKKFLQSISLYKEHFTKLRTCSEPIAMLDSFEIFAILVSNYDVFFNTDIHRFLRYLNQKISRREKSLDHKINNCINKSFITVENLMKNVSNLLFKEKQKVIDTEVFLLRNILLIPENEKEKSFTYGDIIKNMDWSIIDFQPDMRKLLDIWISSEYLDKKKLTEKMKSKEYGKFRTNIEVCIQDIINLKKRVQNDLMEATRSDISFPFLLYFIISKMILRYLICVPLNDAFISINLHHILEFIQLEKEDAQIQNFINTGQMLNNRISKDFIEKHDSLFYLVMIYLQLQIRHCLLLHLKKLLKEAMELFENYMKDSKEKKIPMHNGRLVELSYKMTECFSILHTMLIAFREKTKVIKEIIDINQMIKHINKSVKKMYAELDGYDVLSISKEEIINKFQEHFREIYRNHVKLFTYCNDVFRGKMYDI